MLPIYHIRVVLLTTDYIHLSQQRIPYATTVNVRVASIMDQIGLLLAVISIVSLQDYCHRIWLINTLRLHKEYFAASDANMILKPINMSYFFCHQSW